MNEQTQDVNPLPEMLQSTQKWFASIITHRLGEDDHIQPYTANGRSVAEESAHYIAPGPGLQPQQRMQIYNQQYWWRLLNTLHGNYPLVVRLFGYQAFNERIGVPYLLKYPPNHWSLTLLGERLPRWVAESYHQLDQPLLYHAASLDWGFISSAVASQYPSLDLSHMIGGNPESLLSYTFYLQPHINLFQWEYDLLAFREAFLKESVEYWTENRFPNLIKGKTYCFILYRNVKNRIAWREVSEAELFLLDCFKKGTSITAACDYIEKQEEVLYEQVAEHLQRWLQEWVQAGWLTLNSKQEKESR